MGKSFGIVAFSHRDPVQCSISGWATSPVVNVCSTAQALEGFSAVTA